MTEQLSVILIGAGNMGGALLASWVDEGMLDSTRSAVIDPNPSDRTLELCEKGGIPLNPENDETGYDIAVLAVKPQMFAEVLPRLNWPHFEQTIFVSIAAGTRISEISALLKGSAQSPQVIRAMPNLPVSVHEGLILIAGDGKRSIRNHQMVNNLCASAGKVLWMETESDLDRYIGISGSGTGLAVLMVEAMEEAAMSLGASEEMARAMAEQVFIGTAALLKDGTGTAAEIRHAVTSQGGTTAAGLAILDHADTGLRKLMIRAVEASFQRAMELGGR